MDVPKLFQMWTAGARVEDIALAFHVSVGQVYRWRRQHKLPDRPMASSKPLPDPSPEELERRKAECRRLDLERLRAETESQTRNRVYRERGGMP